MVNLNNFDFEVQTHIKKIIRYVNKNYPEVDNPHISVCYWYDNDFCVELRFGLDNKYFLSFQYKKSENNYKFRKCEFGTACSYTVLKEQLF